MKTYYTAWHYAELLLAPSAQKCFIQWSLCCTVLWTASLADCSSAVPIDRNLDTCSSPCSRGGSGWTAEVNRKSESNAVSLLLISILGRMSLWTLGAASLSRRAAELSLWYALGITWAFIFIYLYCMGWILNSSFSSQCKACCKSITIVQRLVYPPGCALFPRRCGILCTSTEMHWLLPSGAFCWKPVNLAFQTWNWNCRGNIFYTS